MAFSFKTWGTETLYSVDLNDQFGKIESKFGSLTNADLSDQANITSSKLRDRYDICYQTINLTGDQWGGNFSFQQQTSFASVTEMIIYPPLHAKRAYLCSVSLSVTGYADGASSEAGTVWVTLDGTTIASHTFTSATEVHYMRNGSGATAFSSPLAALSDGNYIGIRCGATGGTGAAATADTLVITLAYKIELSA